MTAGPPPDPHPPPPADPHLLFYPPSPHFWTPPPPAMRVRLKSVFVLYLVVSLLGLLCALLQLGEAGGVFGGGSLGGGGSKPTP